MFKACSAGRIEHSKVCGAGCGNGSGYAAWLKCWSSQLLARSGKVRKKANAFLLEMVVDVVALEGSVMCIKFLLSRALIIKVSTFSAWVEVSRFGAWRGARLGERCHQDYINPSLPRKSCGEWAGLSQELEPSMFV